MLTSMLKSDVINYHQLTWQAFLLLEPVLKAALGVVVEARVVLGGGDGHGAGHGRRQVAPGARVEHGARRAVAVGRVLCHVVLLHHT